MTENHTPQKTGEVKYLTKGEAATFTRFGVRTIDRWMSRGWLPFVKLPNGQVRFRENDLRTAMDRQWDMDRTGRDAARGDPSMG